MNRNSTLGVCMVCAVSLGMASYKFYVGGDATASIVESHGGTAIVAARQDLTSHVTVSGVLHNRTLHRIYSQTDGAVKYFRSKLGDDVKKGATLLEFDPEPMRREERKISAQNNVLRVETEFLVRELALHKQKAGREASELADALQLAKEEAEQAQQAFERGMISDAERRKKRMKVEELERQRELANVAAKQAERRIGIEEQKLDLRGRELGATREELRTRAGSLKVVSPADGRIVSVSEKLSPGNGTDTVVPLRTGEFIVGIAEQDRYAIRLILSEKEVLQVRQGSSVRFVQKSGGARGSGVVRTISGPADVSPGAVSTFAAEIDVAEVEGNIVVGGRVECKILVAERKAVVAIPMETIGFNRGQPYARVIERDKIVPRQLQLGADDGKLVEIQAGISEGEQVLRSPIAPKSGTGTE